MKPKLSRRDKAIFIVPFILVFLMLFMLVTAAFAGTKSSVTLGDRSYELFIPDNPISPMPLVLAVHPGINYSSAWENAATGDLIPGLGGSLDNEAEQHGFAVAYPDGTGYLSIAHYWNARTGKCCGTAHEQKIDDLDFLRRVIADLSLNQDIDENNVYLSGYSNGAMMSHSYACNYPSQVKGMVLAAGVLMLDQDECTGYPAIPVTYMYGDLDTNVPPAGGVGSVGDAIYPVLSDTLAFISASGATQTIYELTGSDHDWPNIVSYLSSQESLVFASVIGDMVFDGMDTLSLDFENQSYSVNDGSVAFASVITFTRASSGTYVDSAGLIQTALTDVPRFTHDPVTLESLGLLVEEAGTNLFTYSEQINSGWAVNSGAVITVNDTTAPNGESTSDLVSMAASATSGVFKFNVTTSATTTYTFSAYIKNSSGGTKIKIGSDDSTAFGSGTAGLATFDTSTNTFSSVGAQIISQGYEQVGAYVRVWLVMTTTAGDATTGFIAYNGDGSAVAAFHLWGMQFEAGAFPMSYIATTASAATRAADVASVTGTNFTDWFNAATGTLFVNFRQPIETTSTDKVIGFGDGTTNNRLEIFTDSTGDDIAYTVISGGVAQAGTTTAEDAIGVDKKAAVSYATNNIVLAIAGTVQDTDTVATVPASPNLLSIGKNTNSNTNQLNGTIKSILFYPFTISDSELQRITE